jgi:uncharacterized protein involved in tellurium resistance
MANGCTSMAVNGRYRQVLIYAFIYQGVPSWDKTDGVVTFMCRINHRLNPPD